MSFSMKLRDVNGPGEGVEKTPQIIESEVPSADQRDAEALARLGKKQVLKVGNVLRRYSPFLIMGGADPLLATFLLRGHVGLHMCSSSDMGSHTDVGPFLLRHRQADEMLMSLGSIYITGLTKYASCMTSFTEL